MARMKLPPGFRFHPTDIELVGYYLKRKVYGRAIEFDIVAEVDIYKCEPWDLPEKSLIGSTDPEWYFFSARDKKYANSSRTNRATEAGYWKATGKDRTIKTSNVVGMKKTLVFYKGRAPHGGRTDWVMHEYRLEDESGREKLQDAFVLCRVFKKNGIGPNHPPSSATIDFEEETGAITTDDILVPDEKPPVLEVTPLSVDTSLKEKDKIPPEVEDDRGVMDESLLSGAPSIPFRTPEDSENGINMFNAWPLKGSDRFLDEHSTVKDSTSELGSLDNLMTAGESASPITAQDIALWLETPTPVRDSNISAAFSGSQMGAYLDFYSSEEAEMLDELYRSTLQSQEFELADQHLSACCSKSKHAMETPIFSKTGSEDTHDISVVDGMFKDEFSALSEQFFDESQVSSSRPVNGSEDVSEEEMLEELMQLVNHSQEGQLPQVEGIQSQGGGVAGGAEEDLFFDILQDPHTDEWMQTGPWNEASTSYDMLKDCLEPVNNHMEDWLTETWASPSDLPSLSESLPEPLGSGLRVNLISSTRPHTPPLQDSSSKPSKLLSRFARLLDSVPVLPASAAEFPPPHVTHQIVESKGGSISNSGKVYGSVQSTSSNFHFRVLTVKCSFGFLFGFWKSSPQPSNQKISVESSVPSPNTPVNDLPLSGYPSKGCSFRHGNGCYSLVFFLGALSALCWFLLLRIAWRFASHMGSLLL